MIFRQQRQQIEHASAEWYSEFKISKVQMSVKQLNSKTDENWSYELYL